ncbi:squalene/phytoene synthase family protein [Caldimonas thermodepolymerans]|uniref:Farnesyl-diphosphate farnesyltransferase n=1 Tax=Caldimonas thermodepolymerans TaxID=215580 RepID=A0A2S5T6S5_9BURK|nr:squalene/phytoene synthase family protein [Caldimonas thermodepolymerans]PPE70666.1 farnesyl-diphosphate farnesyltransferase [Caldimonas thermodepolymerans]QPC33246.1 squalene/phytoene synthase family protein [Caldimonas thermodepolymerans]RDH97570.1 farnesyl-diphosphate farnesyltransferase [Caldimonas thermodepolymerans]TCP09982.1 farnesyl-diphosphate farnesyltransferase [Caldimonas thermodepolymerans]UZG46367.1 squalene/phytoene synthase family protein [Caldimonas thermodepolymerans]
MTDRTGALLGELLQRVSRSFYLSLRALPAGLRTPVSLAYLLARAADTVADTPGQPEAVRLAGLAQLRAAFLGQGMVLPPAAPAWQDDERRLWAALPEALQLLQRLDPADQAAIRRVLGTLVDGMEYDLRRFAGGTAATPVMLAERAELDRYTYLVAGCVGEFWTAMAMRHCPAVRNWPAAQMSALAVDYGKALQLTNVLRDCGEDLAAGRCYLPSAYTGAPEGRPLGRPQALPALGRLSLEALALYRQAAAYVLAIPRRALRLRLASLWPLMIGLATLRELARNPHWPDPGHRSKVRRGEVYRILGRSVWLALSDRALRHWFDRAWAEVEAACRALDGHPAC